MDLRTAISGSRKTGDVIPELLKARDGDGLSPRYLRGLRVRLARFADVFGEQMILQLHLPKSTASCARLGLDQ